MGRDNPLSNPNSMFFSDRNNYLLTGNKVALFFHRDKLEIFYYPSDSEGNNSSRVCRGEKKALYYRLIRNFIFFLHFINTSKNAFQLSNIFKQVIKTQ